MKADSSIAKNKEEKKIGYARKEDSKKTGETREADFGAADGRGRHTDRRQRHFTVAIGRFRARIEEF
jgi:hypothetical protein